MKIILIVSICALFLTAYTKTETSQNSTSNLNSAASSAKNTGTAQATPKIDPNTQATFPFADFPACSKFCVENDGEVKAAYEIRYFLT